MPSPTFLGIGAQKAGTTWLADNLRVHPDVHIPEDKELHFFDKPDRFARGLQWYEAQLGPTDGAEAVGEITPAYLWTVGDSKSAEQSNHRLGLADDVAAAYPDVRLIVSLRHPVDRAIAGQAEAAKYRAVPPGTAISRAIHSWSEIDEKSRYAKDLSRWFDLFPREAFLILIYEEDIRPDAAKAATLRRVYTHLGVDPDFVSPHINKRSNSRLTGYYLRRRLASRPVRLALRFVPHSLRALSIWSYPDPNAKLSQKEALWQRYEPDVRRVEEMLGRDLPWLPPESNTSS